MLLPLEFVAAVVGESFGGCLGGPRSVALEPVGSVVVDVARAAAVDSAPFAFE